MQTLGWVLAGLVLLALLGWYLSYSAGRLDRLHHKVESSRAALETQLTRRAALSVEAAAFLDPASGLVLAGAAAESLAVGEGPAPDAGEDPADLEVVESDLTRALQAVLGDPGDVAALRRDPVAADLVGGLAAACARVQMARRFHNEAVAQVRRVRRKPVVRWTGLAGHAALPQTVEFDDDLPAGLRS